MKEEILLFIDNSKESLELIEATRKLDASASAIVLGEAGSDLEEYGLKRIYKVNGDYSHYNTRVYKKAIVDCMDEIDADVFLFLANDLGRDLAPRVAAKLETGLTADVTRLRHEDGKLIALKPGDKRNVLIGITSEGKPNMITLRPGAFDMPEKSGVKSDVIIINSLFKEFSELTVEKTEDLDQIKSSIEYADITVAGGRGLGGPEGFKLLREFADKVGGEVACSAACVDQGWIDHSYQIGQTGIIAKPKIYFACGISGSIQHMAGIEDSDIIVAINKDRDAQVFDYADYKIVGDLYEVIPELIRLWP